MKVSARLDGLPIGRFHYRLLILSRFGWLFDAMDSGLVSFILRLGEETRGRTLEQISG